MGFMEALILGRFFRGMFDILVKFFYQSRKYRVCALWGALSETHAKPKCVYGTLGASGSHFRALLPSYFRVCFSNVKGTKKGNL